MSDPLPSAAPSAGLRRTSTTTIAGVVSGVLVWTLMPQPGRMVAVVTGHLARAERRCSPQEDDGLALAGLVRGYTAIGIALLAVIAIGLLLGGLAAFFALASHWS